MNMQGYFYEVVQGDDEQWRMLPKQGHGPQLRHNGAGAWRVWCEQPVEWDDTHRMFRRLGGEFRQLEDDQIDQVLAIHGMEADALRGLHVCGQAPHACLVDTVSRVRLANRIKLLVSQLRGGGRWPMLHCWHGRSAGKAQRPWRMTNWPVTSGAGAVHCWGSCIMSSTR